MSEKPIKRQLSFFVTQTQYRRLELLAARRKTRIAPLLLARLEKWIDSLPDR